MIDKWWFIGYHIGGCTVILPGFVGPWTRNLWQHLQPSLSVWSHWVVTEVASENDATFGHQWHYHLLELGVLKVVEFFSTAERTESVAFVLHIPRASPASGTGERGTCSMVNEVECIIECKSREDKTQGIAPGTNNAPIGVFWYNLHDAFAKGRLNWIEKDIDFLHRTEICHKLSGILPTGVAGGSA